MEPDEIPAVKKSGITLPGWFLWVVAGCLAFGYSSGFDEVKDLRTMFVVGVLAGLTESIKRLITQ